jgi:hypothetical protein
MLAGAKFERLANDAYWTPAPVTEALLGRVQLRGIVWEPACGRGDMVRVIERAGYPVVASDVASYETERDYRRQDFLETVTAPLGVESIVTNPPYSHAQAFIEHAIALMLPRAGMVAMLLRNEYDSAKSRRTLFENPVFREKLVLTFRPRWIDRNGDAPQASPRHNFAWYLWDHRHCGAATLGWLP